MKNWIKLTFLKIINMLLHIITLGIPKLVNWLNRKIAEIEKELNIKE